MDDPPVPPDPAAPDRSAPDPSVADRSVADPSVADPSVPSGLRMPSVPPDLQRWADALARPHWPTILGAAVAVIAAAVGVSLTLPPATPAGRCAGRACHPAAGQLRTEPPAGPAASPAGPARAVSSSAMPAARRPTPAAESAPAASAPTSTPAPAPPASTAPVSTAPAGSPVSVSYTLVKVWDGGFQGEFTIVNDSGAPVDGWQLAAELPGDQVQSAWDASFQVVGDTMILTPPSYQVTIEPGASLAEHFTAGGTGTEPQSCTFNGRPCS
jgi:Cellulose binding domain